jgi:tetrapyrrole methylase family protein/MazG family protein
MPKMAQITPAGSITLIGLGPGDPGLVTREAWDWLCGVDQLYLRTSALPLVSNLPPTVKILSFDGLLNAGETPGDITEIIVEQLMALAASGERISYGVPGHPLMGEVTCPETMWRAKAAGYLVRVIAGMSLIEPTLSALNMSFSSQMTITDALELSDRHTPGFPPSSPTLVTHVYSSDIARKLKTVLATVYPGDHPVTLVFNAGTKREELRQVKLSELGEVAFSQVVSSLFVPPLSKTSSFEAFQEVIARLRAPEGCPWDRKQTHASLRPFLLEESYEALDALDREDMADLEEELGDLLLQILLHAQIAEEDGDFNINSVIEGIASKLIRRHPHVFGEVDVEDVSGVIRNWEAIKAEERKKNGKPNKTGLLDGVPVALPALLQAQEIIERVHRVDFDPWLEQGKLHNIHEMMGLLNEASDVSKEKILGNILISLTSIAYRLNVDAETSLREALSRFRRRFTAMETQVLADGRSLPALSTAEKRAVWSTLQQETGEVGE